MTEREKMLHAKSYIDMLAEGRNPLTGLDLPNDSALNQAQLVRCFFYVSELIERLALVCDENGHLIGDNRKPKRVRVASAAALVTPEMLAQVALSEEPLPISIFAKHVAGTLSESVGQPIAVPVTWITGWLAEAGYLRVVERREAGGGKTEKVATALGEQNGITTIEDMYNGQRIHKTRYSKQAQQLILANLPEILQQHQ